MENTAPNPVETAATEAGYELIDTGLGCTAFCYTLSDEPHEIILISSEVEECTAPTREDEPCIVCAYRDCTVLEAKPASCFSQALTIGCMFAAEVF